jgi:hypothetical protein
VIWLNLARTELYRATKVASIEVMSNLSYTISAYSAFPDKFFGWYPISFIMRISMLFKDRIQVLVALSLSILAFILTIFKLTIFGGNF